jgi:alcohol dehydrogenase class IV
LTGNSEATAEEGADWLGALANDLDVPGVGSLCTGITSEQIPMIAKLTASASSTKGNPVTLDFAELKFILESAM